MGDLVGGLFGKNEEQQSVQYLPTQLKDIDKTYDYKWDKVIPGFGRASQELEDEYLRSREGVGVAGQQKGGYAGQVGEVLGETGESALRTGITGLQNLFDPNYERNQIMAALAPAESQYMQNLANQQANFGGAGQLGSARQALADRQLAGQTQAAQMATAANIQQQIANQRLSAANQLAQLGQSGLTGGLGAMDKQVEAAMLPLQFAEMYRRGIQSLPEAAYKPPYPNQAGTTTTKSDSPGIVDIIGKVAPFL